MIQPATLPAAGTALLALGPSVGDALEAGVSGDFSSLLTAKIEPEPASTALAAATPPALAAASGKAGGKNLPDALAGSVRLLPRGEVGAPATFQTHDEPEAEPPAEMSDSLPSDAPIGLVQTLLPPAGVPQLAPLTPAPPKSEAPASGANKPAMPRFDGQNRFNPSLALTEPLPSPRQAKRETLEGEIRMASPVAGASPVSMPTQVFAIGALPQPLMALPVMALPAVPVLDLPAAPFAVDVAALAPVGIAPAEASPPLPSAADEGSNKHAFSPRPVAALSSASGHSTPQGEQPAASKPAPDPANAAGREQVGESPPAPVAGPIAPIASAVAPAAAQLSSPAIPAPLPSPASGQPPHDFTALIDRLVEARDLARSSVAPGVVHAAVAHADFGQVSLQFQQDGGGLTVALTSHDPEFARAVHAAAPASQTSTGSDQYAPPRQDTLGQQSSSTPQSGSHHRGQPHPRDTDDPRPSANPSRGPRGGDEPAARGGIFA